ncbi:hypothetical protein L3Q82_005671 [Scortum barcoo]|uniref:Uncharacterized protein n=1 Tax=Scortum barcoo TaxID=214431 RepID=A0ACB8V686_9TELE|nr:hypothetical protein L3Q82_005671 [Scortum barcoo]
MMIMEVSMENVFDEQCLSINASKRKKSADKGQRGGKTRKTLQSLSDEEEEAELTVSQEERITSYSVEKIRRFLAETERAFGPQSVELHHVMPGHALMVKALYEKEAKIIVFLLCAALAIIPVIAFLIYTVKKNKSDCYTAVDDQKSHQVRTLKRDEDRQIYSAVVFVMMKTDSGAISDAKAAERERIYAAVKDFGLDHARFEGVSLNEVLLPGPNLTNSLLGVLLRFREEPVAIIADIKQMFYCFLVQEEDRDVLRFLWFKNNNPEEEVVEYCMRVHVFGNSPSPAVATYGLRRAAQEGEKDFGSDVCHFITTDFYVDDALSKIASNKAEVMKAFPKEARAKGMELLDLAVDDLPIQRSLGVAWNMTRDTLTFNIPEPQKPFTRERGPFHHQQFVQSIGLSGTSDGPRQAPSPRTSLSRPLLPVSSDPEVQLILTPSMLLTQKIGTSPTPPGNFSDANPLQTQWKRVQALAEMFWARWRQEYLSTLQSRQKWHTKKSNLKEGDVVLLKDKQARKKRMVNGKSGQGLPKQ